MAELQPIIVFHSRHFVRHLGICNRICVNLLQLMSGVITHNSHQKLARDKTVHCIDDINSWMRSNRLRLNPTKTEFMWCATSRRLHHIDNAPINISGAT